MNLHPAPAALALCTALLGGCAAQTPNLDSKFGYAVASARLQQALAPTAAPQQALAGIDGKAAKAAYDASHKSFQEPQAQSGALTIGVGR
jgi:hypothetical protein